jgi:hypothetical protein
MFKLSSFFDRLLVVCGALVFLQFPLFLVQYQQQLGARESELQWQVVSMEKTASASGKSLNSYITKFEEHKDKEISSQGLVMKRVHTRWVKLHNANLALQKATLVTKPIKFVYYFQWDVVKATFQAFSPGIPFSLEGAFWALVGMVFGFLFYEAASAFLKKTFAIKSHQALK